MGKGKLISGIALVAFLIVLVAEFQWSQVPAKGVTVSQILASPKDYDGRQLEIEGILSKTIQPFGNPFLLNDGTGEITVYHATLNLDQYLGLSVRVAGKVVYSPDIVDAPRVAVEVTSISSAQKPSLYVEWTRAGGVAGLQDTYIVDNLGRASAYRNMRLSWTHNLTQTQEQRLRAIIAGGGFFAAKQEDYGARHDVTDFFSHRLRVILSMDGSLQENDLSWVDEWASKIPLPKGLTEVQQDLGAFFSELRP